MRPFTVGGEPARSGSLSKGGKECPAAQGARGRPKKKPPDGPAASEDGALFRRLDRADPVPATRCATAVADHRRTSLPHRSGQSRDVSSSSRGGPYGLRSPSKPVPASRTSKTMRCLCPSFGLASFFSAAPRRVIVSARRFSRSMRSVGRSALARAANQSARSLARSRSGRFN